MHQPSLFDPDARIVKSNKLIKSKVNWTILEHRIVAMLISQLDVTSKQFDIQRIRIRDLKRLSGRTDGSLYEEAEEACQSLINQSIEVRKTAEDGRRSYRAVNLMSSCKVVEGGYIEARFTEDMRPYLLRLKKRFTQYGLSRFLKLRSQHSMRMYELLKMREDLRYLRMSVEEVRELLGCEHSYSRFSDFRRLVIDKAQEELEEKSDIYFTYTVDRDGQTPVRINIMIRTQDVPGAEEIPGAKESGQDGPNEKPKQENPTQESYDSGNRPTPNLYSAILENVEDSDLEGVTDEEIAEAAKEAKKQIEENRPDLEGMNRFAKTLHITEKKLGIL